MNDSCCWLCRELFFIYLYFLYGLYIQNIYIYIYLYLYIYIYRGLFSPRDKYMKKRKEYPSVLWSFRPFVVLLFFFVFAFSPWWLFSHFQPAWVSYANNNGDQKGKRKEWKRTSRRWKTNKQKTKWQTYTYTHTRTPRQKKEGGTNKQKRKKK